MTEPTQPLSPIEQRRLKDQQLFHEWKTTGSKQAMGALINQLSPVIYNEIRSQSGTLPTSALSAEAKKWAVKALQTYDPNRGVLLSTHVANTLMKVRRMNARFANAVRLPENYHYKFNEFNRAIQDLTDMYNREPTEEELAHHLGWSKPHIVKFKGMLYADHLESVNERPSEFTQFNDNAVVMEHILSQLTPQEKFIFDHKGEMPASEMAEKLGVNINRLNYLSAKMVQKIRDIQHDLGVNG